MIYNVLPFLKFDDEISEIAVIERMNHYIEERKGPNEIIALGFSEELVKRTLKMVNNNEWKRLQAPPVLRVSSKSFGPGRRMPLVAKYLG